MSKPGEDPVGDQLEEQHDRVRGPVRAAAQQPGAQQDRVDEHRAGDAEHRQLGVGHRPAGSRGSSPTGQPLHRPDRLEREDRAGRRDQEEQHLVQRQAGPAAGRRSSGAGRRSSARRGSRTGPRPRTRPASGRARAASAASARTPGCAAGSPAARCRAGRRRAPRGRRGGSPEPRPQRPGRGLGVVGLGDRPDHDDPGRAGGEHLVQPVQRRSRRSRTTAGSRWPPRTGSGPGRAPGGRAWSGSARSGRRRSSPRPARRRPRRPGPGRGWTGRPAAPGRSAAGRPGPAGRPGRGAARRRRRPRPGRPGR